MRGRFSVDRRIPSMLLYGTQSLLRTNFAGCYAGCCAVTYIRVALASPISHFVYDLRCLPLVCNRPVRVRGQIASDHRRSDLITGRTHWTRAGYPFLQLIYLSTSICLQCHRLNIEKLPTFFYPSRPFSASRISQFFTCHPASLRVLNYLETGPGT